jgi:L-fuculose-phosphate aldolase
MAAHPTDEIVRVMERIYHRGMTTTSGGNLSILDGDGGMWITPSRVDKGGLKPEDIIRVRPDGACEGRHPPSSEYPFHLQIYRARTDLRAIVHAHVPAVSAFAVTNRVPDTRVLPQARFVCGAVGNSPYVLPGSDRLGEVIAAVFRGGHTCVEMANHGFVVGGETLQRAFEQTETLEYCARLILKASILGRVRILDEEQYLESQRAGYLLPEFTPGLAGHREMELRRQLCQFADRGYDQGLIISTEGSMSVRLDGDAALFTPFGKDRKGLRPEDIVLVRDGRRETGKLPSRACLNHLALYRRHAGIGAVFNALPVNASAFGVAGVALPTRIIPESYLLLRDVPILPYAEQYRDGRRLAELVGAETPVLLYENNGAIATGANLLEAYDRMEVLEATAKIVLAAKPLGEPAAIADEEIAKLRRTFLGG